MRAWRCRKEGRTSQSNYLRFVGSEDAGAVPSELGAYDSSSTFVRPAMRAVRCREKQLLQQAIDAANFIDATTLFGGATHHHTTHANHFCAIAYLQQVLDSWKEFSC